MASLLIGATVLSYDAIKKSNQKRRARKTHNNERYADLERSNAARIAHLQGNSCFCQQSDWQGGGCEVHGYVPAAGEEGGPPLYEEYGVGRRGTMPPDYVDDGGAALSHVSDSYSPSTRTPATTTSSPYMYRRGQEDGYLAAQDVSRQGSRSTGDLSTRPPPPMQQDEVRRINEERRKRMRSGGFTNFVLRLKGDRRKGERLGE